MSSLPSAPNVGDPQLRTYLRLLREKLVSLESAQAAQVTKTTQITQELSSSSTSVTLSNAKPKALAAAAVAGVINKASRDDHQHPFPTAAEVGADPEGSADAALTAAQTYADTQADAALTTAQTYADAQIALHGSARYRIEADEAVVVDAGHLLLITDLGLDVEGDLDLAGELSEIN